MLAPIVVFDLDGTLVDTAPDLVNTLNLMLGREGLAPLPFEEARSMIGGGVRAMLARGLRARERPLQPGELDHLFDAFIEHYSAHIADRSRAFSGLETALNHLAEKGCQLAVCTNKFEWLSRRLLDALELSKRFSAICGQDTFGVKKPDPKVLWQTIRKAGGDQRRAVMVGDSAIDITLARAANVPVIAVDFGYTDVPVAMLRPDRVVDHFSRLPDVALELLSSRIR
jgi:phosphoglycolate phosphatase